MNMTGLNIMPTNDITFDIRCGHCNKKLSEIKPPATLMVQRIKCPRCGEICEVYVIKETNHEITHKPKEQPKVKPEETKSGNPQVIIATT